MEVRGTVKTFKDWTTDAAKSLRLWLRDEFNDHPVARSSGQAPAKREGPHQVMLKVKIWSAPL